VGINSGFQEQQFTGEGAFTRVENDLKQTFNDIFVIKE
jgi:hypothetical protein